MKLRLLILIFSLFTSQQTLLEFEELKTKKGITFWFVKDSSLPLVSMSFSFKGGSFLDPKNKEGSTNLMVSLLDEGTENFTPNEFKLSLRENGTKISFSTEKDRIDGTFQVVSSQVQEGFGYCLNPLINPYLILKKLKKVKKQIVASINIDQSDVQTQASEKFNKIFFKKSKLSRNIKGDY